MTRRPGVTLVEVLVAILITGVGLLALLTLFPLGALEMAQSIKDDRNGHIKHNAAAIANIWNIRNDPLVQAGMLNPGGGLPSYYLLGTTTINPRKATLPSYPVFVDPNGWWANTPGTPWQSWVAGAAGQVPARVTFNPLSATSTDPQFLAGAGNYRTQQLLLWTTFMDDMSFPRDDPNGIPEGRPCIPPLGTVDRAPRYSWAYVCQMPRVGSPTVVNLTVVVYSGRALNAATTGENAFSAVFNPAGSVITVNWGAAQNAPDVQVGNWIFDATMTPSPHGYFYRVLNVTQTGANSMDVEVQAPLRGFGSQATGTVVIFDNVVEVFVRGTF